MKRGTHQQRSSDPLPYVQVDRAVKPKATSLATLLKVSPQHALGTLVDFWELCGDPRELEQLLTAGRNEVVLDAQEVRRRFHLASGGLDVDPANLRALGLLEDRQGGEYRVRGMSRYLAPIRKRLHARNIAAAGGKARASAARTAGGRFTGGGGSAGPPAGAQAGPLAGRRLEDTSQNPTQEPAYDQPTDHPTASQPTSAAGSGQRAVEKEVRAQAPGEEKKPPRPRTPSAQEEFHAWAQAEAGKLAALREPERPPEPKVLNAQLKPALGRVGRKGLEQAWSSFLADKGAQAESWPWGWFVSQWERHFNAASAARAGSTKEAKCVHLG